MADDWEGMPKRTARHLVDYANALPTEEVCGFVLVDWKIEPVLNMHPEPATRFSFDEEHLISLFARRRGEVRGIFHSHPHGNPHPSDTDCNGWAYPMFRYWIIANHDVYEWEIKDGLAFPIDQRGSRGATGLAYPILASPEAL